jgi:hypothetical protein
MTNPLSLLLAIAFAGSAAFAHFTVVNRGATVDFGRASTVYSPCWASYQPANKIMYAWYESDESTALFVSILSVDPSTGNVSTIASTKVGMSDYPPEISCSLGDDMALVGDPSHDGHGRVYIFDHSTPTELSLDTYLEPSDLGLSNGFSFGTSLALSDDGATIFSGTPDDGTGKVYALRKPSTEWEVAAVIDGSLAVGDGCDETKNGFGYSLAFSNGRLFVGHPRAHFFHTSCASTWCNQESVSYLAPESKYVPGRVVSFVDTGNNWSVMQYFHTMFLDTGDEKRFGQSIAAAGDYLVIGAPADTFGEFASPDARDAIGQRGGRAYLYQVNDGSDTFSLVRTLGSGHVSLYDCEHLNFYKSDTKQCHTGEFGASVAVTESGFIAVGAPQMTGTVNLTVATGRVELFHVADGTVSYMGGGSHPGAGRDDGFAAEGTLLAVSGDGMFFSVSSDTSLPRYSAPNEEVGQQYATMTASASGPAIPDPVVGGNGEPPTNPTDAKLKPASLHGIGWTVAVSPPGSGRNKLYASSSSTDDAVVLYRVDDLGELTEAFILGCPHERSCYKFGATIALSRTHLFITDLGGGADGHGTGCIAVYELKGAAAAGPEPDQVLHGDPRTTSRLGEALAVTPDGSSLAATLNFGSSRTSLVTFSLNATSGLYEWDNEFTLNSFADDTNYVAVGGIFDSLAFSDDGQTLVVGDGHRSFAKTDELAFVQQRTFPSYTPSTSLLQVGRAIVLQRDVSTWAVHSILYPPGVYSYLQFGHSVDICGGTIIVGAPYARSVDNKETQTGLAADYQTVNADDVPYGYATVFGYNDETDTWEAESFLGVKPSDTFGSDNLMMGSSVACHDGVAIVGAPGKDTEGSSTLSNAGAFYSYKRSSDGAWSLLATTFAETPAASNAFGGHVTFDRESNRIMLAAPAADNGAGQIFVYGAPPTPAPTPSPTPQPTSAATTSPTPAPSPSTATSTSTSSTDTEPALDGAFSSAGDESSDDGGVLLAIVGSVLGCLLCLAVIAAIVFARKARRLGRDGQKAGVMATELSVGVRSGSGGGVPSGSGGGVRSGSGGVRSGSGGVRSGSGGVRSGSGGVRSGSGGVRSGSGGGGLPRSRSQAGRRNARTAKGKGGSEYGSVLALQGMPNSYTTAPPLQEARGSYDSVNLQRRAADPRYGFGDIDLEAPVTSPEYDSVEPMGLSSSQYALTVMFGGSSGSTLGTENLGTASSYSSTEYGPIVADADDSASSVYRQSMRQ